MDTFSQSLLKQLEQASGQTPPWGDVNPLVVIGLTEAVLDSGATEDGIYRAIRAYSRQLAADVSPDRNPDGVSKDRLAQIMAAFNYIDDRDNFTRALADFRILKAEDRRESRLLNLTVGVLRGKLSQFEGQTLALKEARESLTQEQLQFELQKEAKASEFSLLESKIERLEKSAKFQKKQHEKMLMDSTPWKRKHEHSLAALVSLGRKEDQGIFAFEAKWVAVGSAWPNLRHEAPPVNSHGEVHQDFTKALEKLKLESRGLEIAAEWKRISAIYGNSYHYGQTSSDVAFSLIKLEAGRQELMFGNPLAVSGLRATGCIPSHMFWVDSSGEEEAGKKLEAERVCLRTHLRTNCSADFVVASMNPYLTPGGLLVSISTNPHRKAVWSSTCPEFKFVTRRIILAVG